MQEQDTPTEATAQSTLSQIFRCEARDTTREEVDRAVGLLQRFPSLAFKTFQTRRHPSARVPLFILAERGATLDQIQSIRKLYDETNAEIMTLAKNTAKSGSSRMHVKPELMKIMESGKAGLDVLSFLVQEYPILLEQRDSLGRCPVHKFLQRWTYGFYGGQAAGACDELALDMIQKYPSSCDLDLFQLALHAGCNDEIVEFMVQQLNQQSLRTFQFQGSFNGTVSLRDAQAISKVLPNLQEFSFHTTPATPSAQAFCHLMDSIAEANSLQKFAITLNGGYLRHHGMRTSEALERALTTPSLEAVTLNVAASEGLNDDIELGVFASALTARTSPLQNIKFLVAGIRSVEPLLAILSSKHCPKSVRIQGGCWEQHPNDPIVQDKPSESSLESLVIVSYDRTINVDAMEAILQETVRAPNLQQFKLLDTRNAFPSKMMQEVVQSLQYAQHLKEVELTNQDGILYSTICQLLTTNVALRKVCFTVAKRSSENKSCQCIVETLQGNNTTLESLECHGIPIQEEASCLEKIGYYLHLNRNGRKRTRDLGLSPADFVDLLSSAMDYSYAQQQEPSHCEKHPGVGSILFGLLRENPTLWTTSAVELKRRASLLQQAKQPARKKAKSV